MQVQHLPEVMEGSKNTDIYAIVRVSDPDPGRHGAVAVLEIVDGDPDAHFRIRKSDESDHEFNVEVLQILDREISPYGYNLTLKATDFGTPPRSSVATLTIKVLHL